MPVAPMAPPAPPPLPSHLLIPFASASAPDCQAALKGLRLPQLEALLGELVPAALDAGDDHSLSLPHERALARALGLTQADGSPCEDGLIPWAAAHSAQPATPQAWLSPCHFQVGMERVSLLPLEQLALDEPESRALFDALAPFCAEDRVTLRFDSATRPPPPPCAPPGPLGGRRPPAPCFSPRPGPAPRGGSLCETSPAPAWTA